MANNYTPSYNQYLTQTAGYALPSSVRSYSVFDPSSNSWRRMTNDGRSPMPVQGQTPVADALALARQTQGRDWSAQPAPVQAPAQTPLGGPRIASNRQLGGGMGASPSQPSASPRGASMSPEEAVAFGIAVQNPGADLQAQPRVFMPLESRYENFQQEIPRSNAYGPLQNPRVVRNMSPDYQEASTAPVVPADVVTKIIPAINASAQQTQPSTTVVKPLPVTGRTYKDVIPNYSDDDSIDVTTNMRDNDNDTVYNPNAPSMYNAGTPEQQAEFRRKLGNFLGATATVATLGAPAVPILGARLAATPLGMAVGRGAARYGKGIKAGLNNAWKNYKNAMSLGENPAATAAQARAGFLNPELQTTYNARNGIPFGFFTR